jgi:hypothetical protein
MDHLFSSVVRAERLQPSMVDGQVVIDWTPSPLAGSQWIKCRLDLNFLRPGKDIPAPINAGVRPDRIGVMFTYADAPIMEGDRIVTIPNEFGKMPVTGTFEIKTIPDEALDYNSAHHIEVQVVEAAQTQKSSFGEANTKS